MDRWQDQVAVVTGASEGIGAGIARKLAEKGMKVVAVARRKELLDTLETDINSKYSGRCFTHVCDVTNEEQVKRTFTWVKEKFGHASVLVNNAGTAKDTHLIDLNLDNARTVLDLNIMGVLNCTKYWLETVKAADVDAHLVNMNSLLGHEDLRVSGFAVYTATKQALKILTRSLHNELDKAKSKIRITSISPGLVKSSQTETLINQYELSHIVPEDVAEALVYALSAPLNVNVSEIIIEPVHVRGSLFMNS